VPSVKATMTFPSRTFMLVFGLFCCGAIFAQENALTVSSGSSVGIPNIGTAPIKVFQASLQSADGSPGPDGRAIIGLPRMGRVLRSTVRSFLIQPQGRSLPWLSEYSPSEARAF